MATRRSTVRSPGRSPTSAPSGLPTTIGVDLGGTKIAYALVAPNGRVTGRHRHPTGAQRGADAVVVDVVRALRRGLGRAGAAAGAVGVGIAGQIDRRGVVVTSPNLDWRRVALRARLEAAVGVPVTVTNDLRAITYGEWQFGAGRGARDLVCVFVGTGVGGGIVADGRLRYGATDTAGEVGHTTVVAGGRPCHCPNRGCLEAYVGGWAIAERAQEAVAEDPRRGRALVRLARHRGAISARTVAVAAQGGDALARQLVRETGDYLAAGLVSVANAFDPAVLVIGGGVLDGMPTLLPYVRRRVRDAALAVVARRLRIVPAALGGEAGVLGAAAMARLRLPGGR
ncbi:MAG TPA: ROK family protein [Thermoplasmata archaeon]|nr:ROK family protein [Thermoplasmata archaeon]